MCCATKRNPSIICTPDLLHPTRNTVGSADQIFLCQGGHPLGFGDQNTNLLNIHPSAGLPGMKMESIREPSMSRVTTSLVITMESSERVSDLKMTTARIWSFPGSLPRGTYSAQCPGGCPSSVVPQNTRSLSPRSRDGCRHRNASTPHYWEECSEGQSLRMVDDRYETN